MASSGSKSFATDRVFESLAARELSEIREIDKKQLIVEQSKGELGARVSHPVHSVENMLREWEIMTQDMSSNWKNGHTCFDDYLFSLDVRSTLEAVVFRGDVRVPTPVVELVRDLDHDFMQGTIQFEPDVNPLRDWLRSFAQGPPAWLWNRAPRDIPW